MNQKLMKIWCVLLLVYTTSIVYGQEYTKIRLGQALMLDQEESDNMYYFKWVIPKKFDYNNSILAVTAKPVTPTQKPIQIFISSNKKPSYENNIQQCNNFCFFKINQFKEPKDKNTYNILLIGVTSSEDVLYFELYLDNINISKSLQKANPNQIVFENYYKPQIFQILTPNKVQFDRVVFSFGPSDPANITQRFNILLLNQNLQEVQATIVDGWQATRFLIIHEGEDAFCQNCSYYIAVSGQENTKFYIEYSFESYNQGNLKLDQRLFLALTPYHAYNLVLTLSKAQHKKLRQNRTLGFEFMVYSGSFQVGINPNTKPIEGASSLWEEKIEQRTVYSLRQKNRDTLNSNNTVYYLELISEVATTLSILPYYENEEFNQILEFSVAELDRVTRDEILPYRLYLPKAQGDFNFTVSLTSLTGEAGLVVKRCKNQNDCELSMLDYMYGSKQEVDHYMGSVLFNSKESGTGIQIDGLILHEVQQCSGTCYYIIGVVGIEEQSDTKIVLRPDDVPIELYDWELNQGYIDKGDSAQYIYEILSWSKYSAISIHFIAISGSAYVQMSTNDNQINLHNQEVLETNFKESLVEFSIPLAIFDVSNKVIKIDVNAPQEACFFNIRVIYHPREYVSNLHSLYEGYTTIHTLAPKNNEAYFGLTLNLDLTFEGIIALIISPNDATIQYELAIGLPDQIPNKPENILGAIDSPDTTLYINSKHSNFTTYGDYVVKFLLKRREQDINKNIRFWIRYDVISTIQDIKFGYPLIGKLKATKSAAYKFPFTERTLANSIEISVVAWNDEVDLIIDVWSSTGIKIFTENVWNAAILTTRVNSSDITIPSDIYIHVHNRRRYSVNYTITLTKYDTDIQIQDAVPTPAVLSKQGLNRNFTFDITYPDKEIQINLQSWLVPLILTAKLCKEKSKCETFKPAKYTLVSPSLQSIEIKPTKLKDCSNQICKLYIQTQLDSDFDLVVPVNANFFDTSHIVQVTQTATVLIEGAQVLGYLEPNEVQYYQFYIPHRPLTAKVVLTTLGDGKASMLVLKGKNSQVQMVFPSQDNHDYTSSAEVTLKVEADLESDTTVPGYYTMGVMGANNCTFLVSLYYTDSEELKIAQGLPLEVYLTQKPLKISYYHYSPLGFEVLVLKEGGPVDITIRNQDLYVEEEGDLIQIGQTTKAQNGKKIFCTQCEYVIELKENPGQPSQRVTLYVNIEKEPLFIQSGKPIVDVLKTKSFNTYAYPFAVFEDITITLVAFKGMPQLKVLSELGERKSREDKGVLYKFGAEDMQNKVLRFIVSASKLKELIKEKQLKGIYIIVESPSEDSKYQLLVHGGDTKITLRDGYVHYGTLFQGDQQTFQFAVTPHQTDQYEWKQQHVQLHFQIENYTEFTALPEFKAVFEEDWSNDLFGLSLYKNTNDAIFDQKYVDDHHGKIHLSLPVSTQGIIYFTFTSVVDHPQNYTVMISSQEITELALNTSYYYFLREGNEHLYHIYINEPGYLLINLQECYGAVTVHAASTYENIINNKFNIKVKSHENVMETKLVIAIKKKQNVYLKILFNNGVVTKDGLRFKEPREAYYNLKLNILEKEPNLQQFASGGAGAIKWTRIEPGAFDFQFNQALQTEGEKVSRVKQGDPNYKINYKLYIAKDEIYLDLISRCGGIMSNSFSIVAGELKDMDKYSKMIQVQCHDDKNTETCEQRVRLYDAKTPHRSETYFATVISEVEDSNTGEIHRLPYDIIEFKTQVVYRTPKDVYYLGLGTVFLVALCYICAVSFNKCLKGRITGNEIEMLGLKNAEERNNSFGDNNLNRN